MFRVRQGKKIENQEGPLKVHPFFHLVGRLNEQKLDRMELREKLKSLRKEFAVWPPVNQPEYFTLDSWFREEEDISQPDTPYTVASLLGLFKFLCNFSSDVYGRSCSFDMKNKSASLSSFGSGTWKLSFEDDDSAVDDDSTEDDDSE